MILLDGKKVAGQVLTRVAGEVSALGKPLKLVIVQVGNDPASDVYIRQKLKAAENTGIQGVHEHLPETMTTDELIAKVHALNEDSTVTGILVQAPLPKHIDTPLVFKAIAAAKDVDGFTAYNMGKMFLEKQFEDLVPCTARGVLEILGAYNIDVSGKEVVVVGRSNIVGKPLAVMLLNRGATVTVCHSKTVDLASHTKRADILVVAVGKAKMITADMVKEGAVVIDVGINRLADGKLCGDVDFEGVSTKASAITPVPGGVGPMTVACLMDNVVRAARRQ